MTTWQWKLFHDPFFLSLGPRNLAWLLVFCFLISCSISAVDYFKWRLSEFTIALSLAAIIFATSKIIKSLDGEMSWRRDD
jgi:hypothetical protein